MITDITPRIKPRDVTESTVQETFDMAMKRMSAEEQVDKCIEEMSELTKAFIKTRQNGVVFSHAVFEEAVHVRLAIDLLEYWIPSNKEIFEKIKRDRIAIWNEYEHRCKGE
jgi:hypothetical protein